MQPKVATQPDTQTTPVDDAKTYPEIDFRETTTFRQKILYCIRANMITLYDAAATRSQDMSLTDDMSTPAGREWVQKYYIDRLEEWAELERRALSRDFTSRESANTQMREARSARRVAKNPIAFTVEQGDRAEEAPEDVALLEYLADFMVPDADRRVANRWLDAWGFHPKE